MVAFTPLALAAALATTASAHFGLEYPVWRSATLGTGHNYSQWTYPCAGVPADLPNGNRTDWPLKGGSVKLDLHHDWTYVFINLGLGANVSNFNYTLTPEFWNATGKGTLCVPELLLPTDLKVADGDQASIQVITVGDSGAGLYNVSFLVASSCAWCEQVADSLGSSAPTSHSATAPRPLRVTSARRPRVWRTLRSRPPPLPPATRPRPTPPRARDRR